MLYFQNDSFNLCVFLELKTNNYIFRDVASGVFLKVKGLKRASLIRDSPPGCVCAWGGGDKRKINVGENDKGNII